MRTWTKVIMLTMAAASLSGCYSLQGPPQTINAGGVVFAPEANDADAVARSSLQKNFADAAKAALASGAGPALQRKFMETGFLLNYANCDDFFWSMGRQQRKANITRDAIAPISALLGGIIALHSFDKHPRDKEKLLQILGMGTSLTAAGLDIYASNFLFGAENIDSVGSLTRKAVAAHAAQASALPVTSFEQAATHLIDNQAYCTPPRILTLTKAAIAAGEVAPRVQSQANLVRANDGDMLAAIGKALQLSPAIVTEDEAGALWSAISARHSQGEYAVLDAKLQSLGGSSPIMKDPATGIYGYKAGWVHESTLRDIFAKMSAATIGGFQSTQKALAMPGGAFTLPSGGDGLQHVDIAVKSGS